MHKDTLKKIHHYLATDPELAERYKQVRTNVLPIKPSQYDIANTCNLRCEGCFYYSGDHAFEGEVNLSEEQMDRFFAAEANRGVNYAHFGGAEPSLVQDRLVAAYRHIKRGTIYTNGIVRIDPEIRYRIHLSIWGNEETDHSLRGAPIFNKVLRNYQGDDRALFTFTINRQSLLQIEEVVNRCDTHGIQITFNHYSPTEQYLRNVNSDTANNSEYYRISNSSDNLLLTPDDLIRARDAVNEMLIKYPATVLYHKDFNNWVTNTDGIYRIDPESGWAEDCASKIGHSMKHFAPDLSEIKDTKCCVPNITCESCRCFSMAMASAIDKLEQFSQSEDGFRQWLNIIEMWASLFLVESNKRSDIKQQSMSAHAH